MVTTWIAAVVARFICRVQDEMGRIQGKDRFFIPQHFTASSPSPIESVTAGDLAKSPPRKRPGLGTLRQQAELDSMADMNKSARIIKANTEALQ